MVVASERRYQHVVWHSEQPFSLGNPKLRPWPTKVLSAYAKYADDPESPFAALFFDEGDAAFSSFTADAHRMGLTVSTVRMGKWNPRAIEAFPYYQIGARDHSRGFDKAPIFDRQIPCGLEPASRPIAERVGCGNTKKQARKLVAIRQADVRKTDIFHINSNAILPAGVFGISWRFRELLVQSGMSGFVLTPILDGNSNWSEEDLQFDVVNDRQVSLAKWFQVTVTSHTEPLKVDGSLMNDRICGICGVHQGGDNPDPAWAAYPQRALQRVDLQLNDQRILPNGEVVTNVWMPPVIASSRLIRLVVENKLTGFSVGKGKWGKFLPLRDE